MGSWLMAITTIGTARLAPTTACSAISGPAATIRSGRDRIRSAAATNGPRGSSTFRYSIAIFRPSLRPNSRNWAKKASYGAIVAEAVRAGPKNPHDLDRLLPARRERPSRHSAAEDRDELAPPHSITSSAVASNLSGTVADRPGSLGVDTSSNLLSCTTGRSAGFAPLRIRPA